MGEYGLGEHERRYVIQYLKKFQMCVIRKEAKKAKKPGEYDVVTSIEKAKSGLMSYLNPMAYYQPMMQFELCFNFGDDADKVASTFVKENGLTIDDYEKIVK